MDVNWTPEKVTRDSDGMLSYTVTYDSLESFAEAAQARCPEQKRYRYEDGDSWRGGKSLRQVIEMAKYGWTDDLGQTLDIVESAVELVEDDLTQLTPVATYDVAGAYCDTGRFIAGEPECMVDFPLMPMSRAGRVVTLCASVCYSSAIEPETAVKRGRVLAALALALQRIGYACEIWIDISSGQSGNNRNAVGRIRVLVKGAEDVIDDARIVYAMAHPSVLRTLAFMVWDGSPFRDRQGGGYGPPRRPLRDLPDGTIYLPELRSSHDVPDADKFIRQALVQLGLLTAED